MAIFVPLFFVVIPILALLHVNRAVDSGSRDQDADVDGKKAKEDDVEANQTRTNKENLKGSTSGVSKLVDDHLDELPLYIPHKHQNSRGKTSTDIANADSLQDTQDVTSEPHVAVDISNADSLQDTEDVTSESHVAALQQSMPPLNSGKEAMEGDVEMNQTRTDKAKMMEHHDSYEGNTSGVKGKKAKEGDVQLTNQTRTNNATMEELHHSYEGSTSGVKPRADATSDYGAGNETLKGRMLQEGDVDLEAGKQSDTQNHSLRDTQGVTSEHHTVINIPNGYSPQDTEDAATTPQFMPPLNSVPQSQESIREHEQTAGRTVSQPAQQQTGSRYEDQRAALKFLYWVTAGLVRLFSGIFGHGRGSIIEDEQTAERTVSQPAQQQTNSHHEDQRAALKFSYWVTAASFAFLIGLFSVVFGDKSGLTHEFLFKACTFLTIATLFSGLALMLLAFINSITYRLVIILKVIKYSALVFFTSAVLLASIILLQKLM